MNHFIFERRKGERVEQFPKINSCTVKAEKQIYTKRAKETKCLEQSWKKSCTGPIRKKKTLRRCFKNAKITFNVPFWCRSLRFDRYCPFRVLYFFTRSFQTRHKFWVPKVAFWRYSVIIDFLWNKSIFSQTDYAVICFT